MIIYGTFYKCRHNRVYKPQRMKKYSCFEIWKNMVRKTIFISMTQIHKIVSSSVFWYYHERCNCIGWNTLYKTTQIKQNRSSRDFISETWLLTVHKFVARIASLQRVNSVLLFFPLRYARHVRRQSM